MKLFVKCYFTYCLKVIFCTLTTEKDSTHNYWFEKVVFLHREYKKYNYASLKNYMKVNIPNKIKMKLDNLNTYNFTQPRNVDTWCDFFYLMPFENSCFLRLIRCYNIASDARYTKEAGITSLIIVLIKKSFMLLKVTAVNSSRKIRKKMLRKKNSVVPTIFLENQPKKHKKGIIINTTFTFLYLAMLLCTGIVWVFRMAWSRTSIMVRRVLPSQQKKCR